MFSVLPVCIYLQLKIKEYDDRVRLYNYSLSDCTVLSNNGESLLLQITCVVVLYIWCAATNPGDPGIFYSTKDLKGKHATADNSEKLSSMLERKDSPSGARVSEMLCLVCLPFSCLCKRCFHSNNQPSEQNACEEGMFFCSLCEAEVLLTRPFSYSLY